MAAIYEPLIRPHPETMVPMAGLATSYKVERGGTRYIFYLRGHQAPHGIRLPGFGGDRAADVQQQDCTQQRGNAHQLGKVPSAQESVKLLVSQALGLKSSRRNSR